MKPAPPVMKMRFPCRATAATLAGRDAGTTSALARRRVRHGRGVRRPRLAARRAARRRRPTAASARSRSSRDGTLSRAGLLRSSSRATSSARRAPRRRRSRSPPPSARSRASSGPARPRELQAPATSDERAIEIPWCLARYDGERRVLDVGYAFAEPAYLAGLVALGAAELAGVDLAEADVPGLRPSSPTCASSRSTTARSTSCSASRRSSTSAATTTSTTSTRARDEHGDEAALRELHRVLAKDGRLLVSVPTGEHDDQGWQMQRTPERLDRACSSARLPRLRGRALRARRRRLAQRDRSPRRARAPTASDGAGAVLLAELHPRASEGSSG